jgi:hypothetical protein
MHEIEYKILIINIFCAFQQSLNKVVFKKKRLYDSGACTMGCLMLFVCLYLYMSAKASKNCRN